MTTAAKPKPTEGRADRRAAASPSELESCRAADAGRIALCYGVSLIGWFPAEAPLDEVLAELARCAAEPGRFGALPWPRCCVKARSWEWFPGEDVVVLHSCRVLAVVTRTADGGLVVRRYTEAAGP